MSSQSPRLQMSANPPALPPTSEIDLTEKFSDQMAQLCLNSNYADVVFVVEDQRLPAHRVILAARSEYFRALLYGGLAESTQHEIELNIPLEAFKELLKYIYSGHLPLSQMTEENIIDILGLANQYGFTELEMAISDYLKKYLSLNNVCAILDAARLYNLEKLADVCLIFLDRNAVDILKHESFKILSKESLEEVLRRDSFFAPEVDIFLAVSDWCRQNSNINIESVVSNVRLPLIDLHNLLRVVRPSGILSSDRLLDAIEEQTTSKFLKYRAALWPEENVATEKFQSQTIEGGGPKNLLDGDVTSYDMERGYARHTITDAADACIMVELGTIYIINHIKILLWDRDNRAYSYYIEISVDKAHWERVIDYSEHYCRSWQYLYFKAAPVRYIKLVGTHNTVNKVFHVVALEAMYTATVPKLVKDIVAPTHNVATVELSAMVVDGVSRTRNALLNGDFYNYDWDSGYTCHQLGSGEIVVRLGQPYYIGSMRLLLWDCDDRNYSYYIESSINHRDWQMVVDKRNEQAKSWQNFTFPPRQMVYIKIVGTRNTANEIFHCVHLECPSQDMRFLKAEMEREKELEKEEENAQNKATTSSGSNEGAAVPDEASGSNSANNPALAPNAPAVDDNLLIELDNVAANERS